MQVVAMLPEDFAQVEALRMALHTRQRAMTFDEQRDLAERLRLLLERAEMIELPENGEHT